MQEAIKKLIVKWMTTNGTIQKEDKVLGAWKECPKCLSLNQTNWAEVNTLFSRVGEHTKIGYETT